MAEGVPEDSGGNAMNIPDANVTYIDLLMVESSDDCDSDSDIFDYVESPNARSSETKSGADDRGDESHFAKSKADNGNTGGISSDRDRGEQGDVDGGRNNHHLESASSNVSLDDGDKRDRRMNVGNVERNALDPSVYLQQHDQAFSVHLTESSSGCGRNYEGDFWKKRTAESDFKRKRKASPQTQTSTIQASRTNRSETNQENSSNVPQSEESSWEDMIKITHVETLSCEAFNSYIETPEHEVITLDDVEEEAVTGTGSKNAKTNSNVGKVSLEATKMPRQDVVTRNDEERSIGLGWATRSVTRGGVTIIMDTSRYGEESSKSRGGIRIVLNEEEDIEVLNNQAPANRSKDRPKKSPNWQNAFTEEPEDNQVSANRSKDRPENMLDRQDAAVEKPNTSRDSGASNSCSEDPDSNRKNNADSRKRAAESKLNEDEFPFFKRSKKDAKGRSKSSGRKSESSELTKYQEFALGRGTLTKSLQEQQKPRSAEEQPDFSSSSDGGVLGRDFEFRAETPKEKSIPSSTNEDFSNLTSAEPQDFGLSFSYDEDLPDLDGEFMAGTSNKTLPSSSAIRKSVNRRKRAKPVVESSSDNDEDLPDLDGEFTAETSTAMEEPLPSSFKKRKSKKESKAKTAKPQVFGNSSGNNEDLPDHNGEFRAETSTEEVVGKMKTTKPMAKSSSNNDDDDEKERRDENPACKKPFKCNYEGCSYQTSAKGSMTFHVNAVHLKIKRFHCDQCDYGSYFRLSLAQHVITRHSTEKPFVCNVCDAGFATKERLKQHVDGVHLGLRKYKCAQCDFSSATKGTLKDHVTAIHMGLKEHRCTQCEFSSSDKYNLKKHVNTIHLGLKGHKCTQCEFSCSEKSSLKRHVNTVHLGLKTHKCAQCDFSSAEKSQLRRHNTAVHLGLKNHKCTHCEFRSARKSGLRDHVNAIHKNLKDF